MMMLSTTMLWLLKLAHCREIGLLLQRLHHWQWQRQLLPRPWLWPPLLSSFLGLALTMNN